MGTYKRRRTYTCFAGFNNDVGGAIPFKTGIEQVHLPGTQLAAGQVGVCCRIILRIKQW